MSPRSIPGVFTHVEPRAAALPVVFDSPHSGQVYPDDFGFTAPFDVLRQGEDTYVEDLYEAAPEGGSPLLHAHFPRTYIDANRAAVDLDVGMVDGAWPLPVLPGAKTDIGIGLIWRLARPGMPVYARKLSVAEVRNRIETYHRPYQDALQRIIDKLHARFGVVWHINCHSMPSISDAHASEGAGVGRPDFCLGDRDGTTCAPEFTAFVAAELRAMGYRTTVNDPYKGVELVRLHGVPTDGRHSLQIEVNRALYMDENTFVRSEGYERLRSDITRLIGAIQGFARESLDGTADR